VLQLYRFDAPLADARPAPHQVLVARVLGEVVARADRSKQRGGQIDFHDMLRLTARALEADAALAARIATRLPWALIDEFQDTDPVQWQIASASGGRPPARGLVIVGDPKQAIYSFRGGDVHTYLAAKRELVAAGAARATLDVCQRSTAPLVAAINRVLARPRSLFVGSGITDSAPVRATGEVTATWADGRPLAPIALYDVGSAGPAPDVRHAIYEATADEIARLVGDPAHRIVGTARGKTHTVGPGDIYVLTRTNEESRSVAAAIRERGVPCAFLLRPSTCSRPPRPPTSPTCSTPWPTRAIASADARVDDLLLRRAARHARQGQGRARRSPAGRALPRLARRRGADGLPAAVPLDPRRHPRDGARAGHRRRHRAR
jgi:exodeoxyribonuclease V beta subunit